MVRRGPPGHPSGALVASMRRKFTVSRQAQLQHHTDHQARAGIIPEDNDRGVSWRRSCLWNANGVAARAILQRIGIGNISERGAAQQRGGGAVRRSLHVRSLRALIRGLNARAIYRTDGHLPQAVAPGPHPRPLPCAAMWIKICIYHAPAGLPRESRVLYLVRLATGA